MNPRRINQLVAGFAEGDAISQEARLFRQAARGLGMKSDIYAPSARIARGCIGDCLPLDDYRATADDIVIYHYAIASACTAIFEATSARRILRYHNITPASFFEGYDDDTARELRAAREALTTVGNLADSCIADSAYNAAELQDLGIGRVRVMPLLFAVDGTRTAPDPDMLERLGGGFRNILFVGRMAPNKCVEELILAFAWYHTCIDARSRLVLVGSDRSCPRYVAMLKLLAARLGLANVCFAGYVTPEQLAACYRSAGVFVCASRHEGYCLPLLEAMAQGVPVVARNMGGMPEAMGGGGVLFDEAEPRVLAQLFHRVLRDAALRQTVLASQERRLAALRERDIAAECRELFDSVAS